MIPNSQLSEIIEKLNEDRKATLAEFLCECFKNKHIEIYLGDAYEDISTEQVSTTYPAVFTGKVIAAYRECLILEGGYTDRRNKVSKFGKQIFINERAIRGLCEVDGNGILDDIFLRSRESVEVKNLSGKKSDD